MLDSRIRSSRGECVRGDTEDGAGLDLQVTANRNRRYARFNFLVELDDAAAEGPDAGFQECRGLGVAGGEYREANAAEDTVRKVTGLNKTSDVTLKRGVVGFGRLYAWLETIHNTEENELHTVRISQMNEDHRTTVATWILTRARIIKHVGGPFNAKGTDAAVEELMLAYERIELEESS